MAEELKANLDALFEEGRVSDSGEEAVRVFQSGFAALYQDPSSSLDHEAERAARGLCTLIPPETMAGKPKEELLGLFEKIWRGVVDMASRIPHRDDRSQMLVVKTLQLLQRDYLMWRDLPHLGNVLRGQWIDPAFEWHPDEGKDYTLGQWLNLNSFVARLLGSREVFFASSFAIWQLRKGLEEYLAEDLRSDFQSPVPAVDSKVAVACEWLIHAGPTILEESLLESQGLLALDEDRRKSLRAGPVFSGHPGFNIERWGFWKRRLWKLRGVVSEDVVISVDRAVEVMEESAMLVVEGFLD